MCDINTYTPNRTPKIFTEQNYSKFKGNKRRKSLIIDDSNTFPLIQKCSSRDICSYCKEDIKNNPKSDVIKIF